MNKAVKFLIYFLIFDIIVIGGYFGFKALKGGGKSRLDDYQWITIDEAYMPKDAVEEFIKNDAVVRGSLPVYIKNYGHDAKILMFFKGLDDWMIIDIKYKNEKEQEIQRTVLYIFANKQWTVGDSGTLMK
jgi:hypothetical protein